MFCQYNKIYVYIPDTADCLLAGMRWNWFSCVVVGGGIEQLVSLQYVQSLTPDYGQKDRPKHVEYYSSKIHLRH